jgi:Flp pilus assembly protein TadD
MKLLPVLLLALALGTLSSAQAPRNRPDAGAPALLERADRAFRQGDLAAAAKLARQAVTQDPSAVHGHMILGIVAAQAGQWEEAVQHFGAVIERVPEEPHGYFYLAQARLYQKQWDAAARGFARALEKGFPDRGRLLVEMAFATNEAGRPEEALGLLGQLGGPPQGPLAAQYWAVTAFAQARLNRFAESIDAVRRARDLDPANPQYWELLISTLMGTDQTPAALREAIRAQTLFPDHPDIQFLFALASYYVSESPLSPIALRNLREAEPGSPRVLLAEGLLHRKEGRNAEATRAFEQAAAQGVDDSHLLLGIVYKENGNAEAAEREFLEAEKANPANGQVQLELAKLEAARGALEQALARLQRAVAFMPASSSAHYQLGVVYARLGRKGQAERHIGISRELDRQVAELQTREPAGP